MNGAQGAAPAAAGTAGAQGAGAAGPGGSAGAPAPEKTGEGQPGGAAPAAAASGGAAAAAAVKKMLKAVIDGKEVEVSEEDAIKAFQKGTAADRRFEDAAKVRKQAETFLELLKKAKSDPRVLDELFRHPVIGADFKKIAEDYLYAQIQREQMTPEQRELEETKEKLRLIEEERQQKEQEQQSQVQKELQAKYSKEYQADIIQTLDQAGLPKSEMTVARMARYLHMALNRGVVLKAADVVNLVKEDYVKEIQALTGGLDGEKLFGILGEDTARKIREFELQKVRAGGGPAPTGPGTGALAAGAGGKTKLTREEFRKRVAARVNNS